MVTPVSYGPTPTLLSAGNYPQLPKLRNETHIALFSLSFHFEWLTLYFTVLSGHTWTALHPFSHVELALYSDGTAVVATCLCATWRYIKRFEHGAIPVSTSNNNIKT